MIRRFEPRHWVSLILGIVLVTLLWGMGQRWVDVAAVQDALERDWEISFAEEDRPPILPEFVDRAVAGYLARKYASVSGYDAPDAPGPAHTRNRDVVYHERFRSLFRGRIEQIRIYYPTGLRGDLGAALARFPGLQIVAIHENGGNMVTELQWTRLCERLRHFPELAEIEFASDSLTDAAIAPLLGHPQKITIGYGHLTPECAKIFATMPRLATLDLSGAMRATGSEWTPSEIKGLQAAFPSVDVRAPQGD